MLELLPATAEPPRGTHYQGPQFNILPTGQPQHASGGERCATLRDIALLLPSEAKKRDSWQGRNQVLTRGSGKVVESGRITLIRPKLSH